MASNCQNSNVWVHKGEIFSSSIVMSFCCIMPFWWREHNKWFFTFFLPSIHFRRWKETLEKCLEESFDDDNDDVFDFLSNYKCYRTPTKENILQIVSELPHQEIIQKPRYVTNCWAPNLKPLIAFPDFQSLVTLQNIYDIKRPTAKEIVKLIKSEPVTD